MTLPPASSNSLATLFKFAIVGLATNAAGFLVYVALTALGTPPLLAMTVLYALGVFLSFAGNSRWTFRQDRFQALQLLKYLIAYGSGYVLNFALLYYFSTKLGYPHLAVQAAAVFIVAAYLFVILRLFIFSEPRNIAMSEP